MSAPDSSISPCCASGHIHEGTPKGSFETLHGLRTYVSKPKDGSKKKTVILLADIFGVDLINTKLVADEWAEKGFYVYLPDVFEGDAIDVKYMNAIVPNLRYQEKATVVSKAADTATMGTVLTPWIVKHREAVVKPLMEKFIQGVRSDSETGKIAAIGFCFGGRYCLVFGQKDSPAHVDAAVAFHPSFLSVPNDVETVDIPSAILVGDKDAMFSVDQAQQALDILKKNVGDKAILQIYPDAVHGFAVRGDDEVEKERKHKEDGFKDAVEFLNRVL